VNRIFWLAGLTTLSFCVPGLAKIYDPPLKKIVKVDVADVRAEPKARTLGYEFDPLQETQVEKGEPVLVFERKGPWARIEAPDQLEYTHSDHWQGYPGWVLWSALTSDLKKLRSLTPPQTVEESLRSKILENASAHLGHPYLWGGRSLYNQKNKSVVTGVDCSGLINWSFRQTGIPIPRDAHEQYMKARPVDPKDLKPADLIFLAKKDNPKKIVHVAFFVGGDELLEAPSTGERVRRITFKERFGKARVDLMNGEISGDRVIYFGTLFGEVQ
jgi:cell wall-associated NlpC family hydrolase